MPRRRSGLAQLAPLPGCVMVARGPKRESDNRDATRWTEYDVCCPDGEQRARIAERLDSFDRRRLYGAHRPAILVRRRVESGPEAQQAPDGEPEILEVGESNEIATGETDFERGESLHPYHEDYRAWHARVTQAREEKEEAEKRLLGTHATGRFGGQIRMNDLKGEYAARYHRELKKARLFTAAQNNTAPREKIEPIQRRLREEYNAEKAELEARIESATARAEEKFHAPPPCGDELGRCGLAGARRATGSRRAFARKAGLSVLGLTVRVGLGVAAARLLTGWLAERDARLAREGKPPEALPGLPRGALAELTADPGWPTRGCRCGG